MPTGELADVVAQAKFVARQYQRLTGRPLGITGEIAELEASRLLNLTLAEARQAGFDATVRRGEEDVRLQIKGRQVLRGSGTGLRVGSLKLDHPWDAALLVLLDRDFEPREMWEAPRRALEVALAEPGSVARNERGSLSVGQFKSAGIQVWRRPA